MSDHPIPVDITLHSKSKVLEVRFDDGACFKLPCEYLRVFSPSGEVRARRGSSGSILVSGKRDVGIEDIRMVGQYAVKLFFDDGHNSGLYDWRYLYELGTQQEENWQAYLKRLAAANASR
ncbi:gamma-butyrobetaine hydroxylase-like domain-containing protein [Solemya velesiana gill symbiont]|uniref:1-(5-phosphoribosyl)-5-((5-phosphoribosylamino)methylideneamino)imidazole-4-carboxamide isomerase n=1 Tax=Solemya velesiana gill symbiont TaxID=1918948 RepID=A0A1T2KSP8_9GAMM|nr:DUF971 domain-containing protein [Solemya velesiana gill symbiont]OOZ35726.1 1-(5-phosphoribosyl)-5-((5-phosphoribosylamino)methylideneamino)imidazole-4-carboxamide isomerase [Solemya velesiana gill symbiont]